MFHSMLEGSWSYQEMVQKGIDQGLEKGIKQGVEQGIEKGIKQGVEKGELKAAKRFLARLVETRFPTLSSLVQNHTGHIQDIGILNAVIDKLLLAETVEQARQAFLEMISSEGSS